MAIVSSFGRIILKIKKKSEMQNRFKGVTVWRCYRTSNWARVIKMAGEIKQMPVAERERKRNANGRANLAPGVHHCRIISFDMSMLSTRRERFRPRSRTIARNQSVES
ncbi:hypothetical protein GWI33_006240 [Rhynchophorus ferrugineus]|uniref:Uncharacterized protein n=1 Tax=Rhynchophorus ferrugineus TaxID=354439 RepID=A0A834MJ35_RHYFE|nr:hypothetical protein GWI33_006240 [Rhynchophorus ferrugineus]